MRMDQELLQVSMYEVSKGRVSIPKSPDELIEFHVKTAHMFNYFKTLIRRGETTLDELRIQVSNRWGSVYQESEEDNIDEVLKEIDEENAFREIQSKEKLPPSLDMMLRSLLGDSVHREVFMIKGPNADPFNIPPQDNVEKPLPKQYNKEDEPLKPKKPRIRKSKPDS